MTSYGLIGVGNMGRGIARNLLSREVLGVRLSSVVLFDSNANNLTSSLLSPNCSPIRKMKVLESHSCMLNQADVVALSLPSESICEKILFDSKFGIVNNIKTKSNKQKVIIDHGTNSKDFAVYCAKKSAEIGIHYIDAPVSGGPQGANAGTLTIMMGGNQQAVEIALPYLQLYSTKQFHFGESGSGVAAKLVNQALVGVHALAACEAIKLADKLDLKDYDMLKDMLSSSWGQSKVLELVMQDYLTAKQALSSSTSDLTATIEQLAKTNTAAPLRNMQKDFGCISQATHTCSDKQSSQPQESFPLINKTESAISTACSKAGLQDAPFAALLKLLQ